MGRGGWKALVPAAALAAVLAMPSSAPGAGSPTGWDGTNPFECVLQQAGFGPTGPDPSADPYCIEFDKRRQNVTELGVVDFLSNEPARTAAASPKCFYFQSDHWRGSVVQSDGSTKTYEWDGHYFFDKAKGEGGVWVTNFNFNGRTDDPSKLPGMPAEYARFFGPGTGGFRTQNGGVPSDPTCAQKAAKGGVYAKPPGTPDRRCLAPSGAVTQRGLGPIALGDTEAKVRRALGDPVRVHRGFLRYCIQGAGKYMVAVDRDRSGETGSDGAATTVMVLTSNRGYKVKGIARGSSASAVGRAFPSAIRLAREDRTDVLATRRGSHLLIGVHEGAVRFLAVYDPARIRSARALRSYIRRSN